MEKRKGRPPARILTAEDAEKIRQIHEWKKEEIERINQMASVEALARKYGASKRAIERVLAYETH